MDNIYQGQEPIQVPANQQPALNAAAGGIAALYAANGVHLWIPHPFFSKGCGQNRDIHPGYTLTNWYHKQTYTTGDTQGPLNRLPTEVKLYAQQTLPNTATMDVLPNTASKPLGRCQIGWDYGDIEEKINGNDVTTTFEHYARYIESYTITITDLATYQSIRDMPNAIDETALIIENLGPFPLADGNLLGQNLPMPVNNQQQEDLWVTDTTSTDWVIRFQKRHFTHHNDTQTITFTRTTLAAQGNGWGFGVPIMCPLDQLCGKRTAAGGFLDNPGHANNNVVSRGWFKLRGLDTTPNPNKASHIFPQIQTAAGFVSFDSVDANFDRYKILKTGNRPMFFRVNATFNPLVYKSTFYHEIQRRRVVVPNYGNIVGAGGRFTLDPVNGLGSLGTFTPIAASADAQFIEYDLASGQQRTAYDALTENQKLRQYAFGKEHEGKLRTAKPLADEAFEIAYDNYVDQLNLTDAQNLLQRTLAGVAAYEQEFVAEYNLAGIGDEEFDDSVAEWEAEEKIDDRLYHTLQEALDDKIVSTRIPTFKGGIVTDPTLLRNRGSVVLREKLFGYKSLNSFRLDDRIFPQFGEWFPLSLQDFYLTFQMDTNYQQFLKPGLRNAANNFSLDLNYTPISATQTRLYLRSRDSVKQEDKELIKLDYLYPEIERFTKITTHANEVVGNSPGSIKLETVTVNGIPDYFFCYVERLNRPIVVGYESKTVPKVKSIKIKTMQQSLRIYSGGELNKWDLADCTRRNSDPLCNQYTNYTEIGAVFISKAEVGTLLQDQFDLARMELEFEIEFERETNDEAPANNARYNSLIQRDTQCTMLFIYSGGNRLRGDTYKMEFSKTRLE